VLISSISAASQGSMYLFSYYYTAPAAMSA